MFLKIDFVCLRPNDSFYDDYIGKFASKFYTPVQKT